MKILSKKYFIIGFFFVSILGSILHFVYKWSGYNNILGFFSAVNESVWEHMKLLFIPYFIYSIYGYIRYSRLNDNFLLSMSIGSLLGLLFIPSTYYTYTNMFGIENVIIDILIFIAAVFVAFYSSFYTIELLNNKKNDQCFFMKNLIGFSILLVILIMFILFTKHAPATPLFTPPVHNSSL